MAVLEKAKTPGAHLLSGAVVNPRGLRRLFGERKRIDDMPFYGPVRDESVLFLTRTKALRIPTPPTMTNHGNYVASLSQLGRWLAEQAEEGGAMILPETAAEKLLVSITGVSSASGRRTRAAAGRARSYRTSSPDRMWSRG